MNPDCFILSGLLNWVIKLQTNDPSILHIQVKRSDPIRLPTRTENDLVLKCIANLKRSYDDLPRNPQKIAADITAKMIAYKRHIDNELEAKYFK